jgi:4-hydroxy-3-methylbut-2-enyl diphosphate reductase
VKIILAQPRGFCAGVIRAIDTVDQALDRAGVPVYVRHEIVHNRHVVEKLRAKGAVFVDELSEVPEGAVTVFSAHGVARKIADEAKARNLPVLDATCPLVSKVHAQGRHYARNGRTLVLIGHEGHEEVEALELTADAPIAYITQTTLSVDDTRAVIAALKARFADVVGPETEDICYATQNRQTAVRELCQHADLLLVVGSSNSSNSNRLREIGREMGLPSYLVADGKAVDPAWLNGKKAIGLTAGASAPEELVQSVIAAIAALTPVTVETLDGVEEKVEFRLPIALERLPARA